MGTSTTQENPPADVNPPAEPKPKADPKPRSVAVSAKAIVAAINGDGDDDDPKVVDALQAALYRFGAQDPSMELPRSWQRVQRRIGAEKDDGFATAEQVAVFADRAGLALAK